MIKLPFYTHSSFQLNSAYHLCVGESVFYV